MFDPLTGQRANWAKGCEKGAVVWKRGWWCGKLVE